MRAEPHGVAVSVPMPDDSGALRAGCASAQGGGAGCAEAPGEEASSSRKQPTDSSAGCALSDAGAAAGAGLKPPQTVREFERALRSLGFTRLQAQAVARRGFGALSASPDGAGSADDQHDIGQALRALAVSLKET